MASVGLGNYVVVVLLVGGSKAFGTKLVLQREPRTRKAWFHAGSFLPNEELLDVAVRELFEEIGLTLTVDDFTLLSNNHVQVPLHDGKRHLVGVFSAHAPEPYVPANLRTLAKVEQDVRAPSTISPDGTYALLESIDVGGLSLTPSKDGLLPAPQRKFKLLRFGFVAQ
jgi:8-oxo-dGTP pyrophosphatase MutT (NUDIX family)